MSIHAFRSEGRQAKRYNRELNTSVYSTLKERSLYSERVWKGRTTEETIESTGDKYSYLLEEGHELNEMIGEPGIRISFDNGIEIASVEQGSSAALAGCMIGDRILEIENQDFDEETPTKALEKAGSLLKGKEGSKVCIRIQRGGSSLLLSVCRDQKMKFVEQIPSEDQRLLIIKVRRMRNHANGSVECLLRANKGYEALVLDLRGNGGGNVNDAQKACELLLPKETALWRKEDRLGNIEESRTEHRPVLEGKPVAILTDRETASAAEMIAVALRYRHRGILIGEKTFGKGIFQNEYPVKRGRKVVTTVGKWRSPSGQWYHERGIEPDVQVQGNGSGEEALRVASEILLSKGPLPFAWRKV